MDKKRKLAAIASLAILAVAVPIWVLVLRHNMDIRKGAYSDGVKNDLKGTEAKENYPQILYFTNLNGSSNVSTTSPTGFVVSATDSRGVQKVNAEVIEVGNGSDSVVKTLSWNLKSAERVTIDQTSDPAFEYQFGEGNYKVKVSVTNSQGMTTVQELGGESFYELPAKSESLKKNRIERVLSSVVELAQVHKVYADGFSSKSSTLKGGNKVPRYVLPGGKDRLPHDHVYEKGEIYDGAQLVANGTNFNIGQRFHYEFDVYDSDGDNLSVRLVVTPRPLVGPQPSITAVKQDAHRYHVVIDWVPGVGSQRSYTFAVTAHDSYPDHYISRVWIINVNDPNNDIPWVQVTSPVEGAQVVQGNELGVSWEANDRHQITGFDLYYSKNASADTGLLALQKGIGYRYRAWPADTTDIPVGDYYIIVEATDSFNPPAKGRGISGRFSVLSAEDGTVKPPVVEPPDEVIPGSVYNLEPEDGVEVKTLRPTISAAFKSASNTLVARDGVKIQFDDRDVTGESTITGNMGNLGQGTIVFVPTEDLTYGAHRVYIEVMDNIGEVISREWSFTVAPSDSAAITERDDSDEDSDFIEIFGLKIPNYMLLPGLGGCIIIIVSVIVPWVFYLAWRQSQDYLQEEDSLSRSGTVSESTSDFSNPSDPQGSLGSSVDFSTPVSDPNMPEPVAMEPSEQEQQPAAPSDLVDPNYPSGAGGSTAVSMSQTQHGSAKVSSVNVTVNGANIQSEPVKSGAGQEAQQVLEPKQDQNLVQPSAGDQEESLESRKQAVVAEPVVPVVEPTEDDQLARLAQELNKTWDRSGDGSTTDQGSSSSAKGEGQEASPGYQSKRLE